MLNIYRVDHIGQVVPELAPQVELLEGLFGFRRLRTWESAAERCKGAMLAIPGTPVRWQVLAPMGEGSRFDDFLGPKRRPGLHHVAVEVNDLDAARRELAELGVKSPQVFAGWLAGSLLPPSAPDGLEWWILGPTTRGTAGDDGAPQPSTVATATASDHPLGIAGIDHICQGYRDRDELARHYQQLFGFREVWRTPDDEHPDLADLVMNIPGSSVRWEIIMPWGEGSFIQRFLDRSGAAPHHVTFEVEDWGRAMRACERRDIPTFDANEGETNGGSWRDAFIHPKHTGGMLVQLFWEERPGTWCRSDKIPAAAPR